MPNLGAPELLIIGVIIVLLFGASRLPGAARAMGRSMRIFRAETKGMAGGDDDDDDDKKSHQQQSSQQHSSPPQPQQLPPANESTVNGAPLSEHERKRETH